MTGIFVGDEWSLPPLASGQVLLDFVPALYGPLLKRSNALNRESPKIIYN